MIRNPLLGGVFLLVIHLYHGSKKQDVTSQSSKGAEYCARLWLVVRLFGCIAYLQIWVSIWKILYLYILTIKVLFILLTTLFFMS